MLSAPFEQVNDSLYIRAVTLHWIVQRIGHARERGQVNHGILSGYGVKAGPLIANVPSYDSNARTVSTGEFRVVDSIGEVVEERQLIVSDAKEVFGEIGADESATACNQHSLHEGEIPTL